MARMSTPKPSHQQSAPSSWIRRWSELVPPGATVLDVACGSGRHLRYFAARGHPVLGLDRDADALARLGDVAECLQVDLEAAPWPLAGRTFGAVVVTNYLWRPLLPTLFASVAVGGVLLYETFASGQAALGRPRNPAFLLRNGELLQHCPPTHWQVVAYEHGLADAPPRLLQRLAAVRLAAHAGNGAQTLHCRLHAD